VQAGADMQLWLTTDREGALHKAVPGKRASAPVRGLGACTAALDQHSRADRQLWLTTDREGALHKAVPSQRASAPVRGLGACTAALDQHGRGRHAALADNG